MRILIVTPFVGNRYGQERVVNDSAKLLTSADIEVSIMASRLQGDRNDFCKISIIQEATELNLKSGRGQVEDTLKKIGEATTSFAPDIVHLIDAFDHRIIKAFVKNYPTVYSAHSVAPTCPASHRIIKGGICKKSSGYICLWHHQSYKCLSGYKGVLRKLDAVTSHVFRRNALKQCHATIAVSDYIKDCLIADGWDPSKVYRIYNPIGELASVTKMPSQDIPKNLLVCAARLNRIKGIDVLLSSLPMVLDLDWELWILGDGELKEELHKKSLELELNKIGTKPRVKFLGHTSFSKTREIIASAKCLIQPNIGPEAFGLSVAESLALGTPVISSDVPALNEIVKHNETGLLFTPRSSVSLAKAIRLMLSEPLLYMDLKKKGPTDVLKRFSDKKHLEDTLSVYHAVLGGGVLVSNATPIRKTK